MQLPNKDTLQKIYGETEESSIRFSNLASGYKNCFGKETMEFFSAPGRTEIVGNHTDHNGGKVIAASIDMDTIGAAFPNDSNKIEIVSEGYDKKIIINITEVDTVPKNQGTISLVGGMIKAVKEFGFQISGFCAYVSTQVISSAGVSSSASFEMLFCTIVNYFFNENRLNFIEYARIGQYAENHYWGKESGLMDQMACAVGGTIVLDFSQQVSYHKAAFQFEDMGYNMVIVNTGKGHANLSHEYSAVPMEMKQVAGSLGVSQLSETGEDQLLNNLNQIEKSLMNDRAILRALHFFRENKRVEQMVAAIAEKNSSALIKILSDSGKSSWELLQNCYSLENVKVQKIALYLALTECFIEHIGDGSCRVHGGGFAGVIMSIIPKEYTQEYLRYIAQYVGKENVYPLKIREMGAVHLSCGGELHERF